MSAWESAKADFVPFQRRVSNPSNPNPSTESVHLAGSRADAV